MTETTPAKPNRLLVITAIVLAGGGAIYLWIINLAIVRDADKSRIHELQMELLATREGLRQSEGDYAFMSGASFFILKPNDRVAAAKRTAGVVLHRGPSLFVMARHLPAAPRGKAYALWAYFGGKPVSAGEFQCAADGQLRGRHTLARDPAGVEGFALSLENAGGVDAPSGPLFLTRP